MKIHFVSVFDSILVNGDILKFDTERFCVEHKRLFLSGDIEENPGPTQEIVKSNHVLDSMCLSRIRSRMNELGLLSVLRF